MLYVGLFSLARKAPAAADIYFLWPGSLAVDPEVWLCGYLWLCTQWGPVVRAAKYFLATSRGARGRGMGAMDNYQKEGRGEAGWNGLVATNLKIEIIFEITFKPFPLGCSQIKDSR